MPRANEATVVPLFHIYALTAVHAAHVLGGLLAVGITAVGARGPSVQRAAMFWHFVGAVWIPMYLFVYVM